jgi:hypothetical protein
MEIGGTRGTEAVHSQLDTPGQHTGQFRDMNTCSAVDLGRELFRHNVYSHVSNVVQAGRVI